MGSPAFNPNADYSAVPAFDPNGTYGAAQASSTPAKQPGFVEGLEAGAQGLWNAVRHPIDTATQMGKQYLAGGVTPYGTPMIAPTGNQQRDEANQAMQQGLRDEQAQQGQFMAQHPAYTAGSLVPGAALAAAGEVLPRIAPPVLSRALLLGKTPAEAYESALKPSTTISQADRTGIVQTGLDQRIPVSKVGVEKIGDLVNDLNDKIAATINTDPNRPIDPNAVATRADIAKAKFANQVNAQPDLNAIEASKQQFLAEQGARPGQPAVSPRPSGLLDAQGRPIMTQGAPGTPPQPAPPMNAADAQAMKKGTYTVLGGKYGEQGSASVEAQKALARGLKEEIATQFPEISNLNAQESKLLDLQPILERAVNRISNHQLVGIGTPVTGAAATAMGGPTIGKAAMVLKAVLDNPAVKSRLAISLSKGANIPYAQAISRVAGYSSALGATVASPQAYSSDGSPSQPMPPQP